MNNLRGGGAAPPILPHFPSSFFAQYPKKPIKTTAKRQKTLPKSAILIKIRRTLKTKNGKFFILFVVK
jgi:hypothetical protein